VALEVFDARTDIRNLFVTPEIRSRIMHFEPGQVSEGHTHDLGHEMFLVLDGQAEFTIAGQSAVLGPGQACVARAGEWHELRTVGDQPMTLYLSVTPHLEPTHTQWDREGGTRRPYRYGLAAPTQPDAPVGELLARHLSASSALADAARENAEAQSASAATLTRALQDRDAAAAHEALEQMTKAFQAFYARLQVAERAWNDLAPAATRAVAT
jgi:quercetin dioxygenase-like cupin family protein/flagellar hook-basal body complex protein FliE